MSDPGSRRRPDWLDLIAGIAAVVVLLLFVLSLLHEWVISAPHSPVAIPPL
jgi:hypothetical protein